MTMINYNKNEAQLQKYIDDCRNQIKNKFFNEEELRKANGIKNDLIKQAKVTPNISLQDALIKHKNNMIDIKLNHTMRVVSDVSKMAEKMNLNIDFENILKVSALLHDIARFDQAIYSTSFMDKECKEFNGMYHAEYGYHLLYVCDKFKDFSVPEQCKYAVSQAVRFHQLPKVTGDLAIQFDNKEQLNPNCLTGRENLNDLEKVIVASLVQMVKDVDMLDILYQHLTGEFPVVRPSITFDINGMSLEEISRYWNINPEIITDFNNLSSQNLTDYRSIQIPTDQVDPKLLIVPKDIQERFFNNESLDLKELQNRQDFTFIIGMWWRLNHFLNNINFVSNLEVVEENKLLDLIYATYPDKYQPLVSEAFEYAKEELLNKRIIKNQGQIYTTRR